MTDQPVSSRSRLPLGLIGALLLIVLVERQLSQREWLQFTTPWAADWRQSAQAARREAPRSEILCFGDSLAKFGVVPAVLERETGKKAYNLALNVGHPGSSYFLLKRALDAGARPSAILIDFKANLLAANPQSAARQWPEFLSRSEWLDLVRETRDSNFAASLAFNSLLTSVRTRFEIRDSVLSALKGEWTGYAYLAPAIRRNWKENRGAQVMPKGKGEIDDAPMAASLYPNGWAPDPVQERYLRRFLKLAIETKATVLVIIPPPLPSVQARRESLGLDEAYSRFLKLLVRDFPGIQVVDGRKAEYGSDLHCDAVHLNVEGASQFSQALGQLIAARSKTSAPASNWVALPRIKAGFTPHPIEDLEESRLAIQQGRGLVR